MTTHNLENLRRLTELVRDIRQRGAYHRKRGFHTSTMTPSSVALHLAEEAVELATEVVHGQGPSRVREEMSDVLSDLACLHELLDVDLDDTAQAGCEKLQGMFVDNPEHVETDMPGHTRSSRQD